MKLMSVSETAEKIKKMEIRGAEEPFVEALSRLKDMVATLRQSGLRIEHLDLGGGLGIGSVGRTVGGIEGVHVVDHLGKDRGAHRLNHRQLITSTQDKRRGTDHAIPGSIPEPSLGKNIAG